MVAFGVTGLQGVGAVLGVAAVVCCAICVSGSLIQDLKVGHILGGTPRKMEIAEIVATVTTSFVLVFPMPDPAPGATSSGAASASATPSCRRRRRA